MKRTAIFYLTAKQKLKSWFSVNFADLYRLNYFWSFNDNEIFAYVKLLAYTFSVYTKSAYMEKSLHIYSLFPLYVS